MDGLVLVAAGDSRRFGGKESKVLRVVGGKPIVVRALAPFLIAVERLALVVVVRRTDRTRIRRLLPRAPLVEGGPTRSESVRRGVEALPERVETILIHDAARPLVSADLVRRVLVTARRHGAAAPATRVFDSLHRVLDATRDQPSRFEAPIDRSSIVAAQTPQAARADILRPLLTRSGPEFDHATDEVALLLGAGVPVTAVRGEARNIKITQPEHLDLAEHLLTEL